jgi:hypothetical protein
MRAGLLNFASMLCEPLTIIGIASTVPTLEGFVGV